MCHSLMGGKLESDWCARFCWRSTSDQTTWPVFPMVWGRIRQLLTSVCHITAVCQQLWEAHPFFVFFFFGYLEIWFRVLLALLPLLTSSSIHTASYKHLSGCARSSWKTQIQLFLFWAAALCRCASTYHCSRSEPMERKARRAPFAHLDSSSCQFKKFLVILPLISIQSATDMLPATPSYIILEQKILP